MNNFQTTKIEVDIDKVRPNPWNPNVMDAKTFEKEKASIKELGFLGSILVREHDVKGYYEILDGEHRFKAAKELGYTTMQVESIGKIEDAQAKLLTVLINNLHGEDDIIKRAKILESLEEGQLQLLPMTAEEIENEKAIVKFDFSIYDKEPAEVGAEKRSIIVQLTEEEAAVWDAGLEEMNKRGMLKGDKKQKNKAMIMLCLQQFLGLAIGKNEDGTIDV